MAKPVAGDHLRSVPEPDGEFACRVSQCGSAMR